MKYDYSCYCAAETYSLIERVVGSVHSYENNMFKALVCKDCLGEHGDVMKAEKGSY